MSGWWAPPGCGGGAAVGGPTTGGAGVGVGGETGRRRRAAGLSRSRGLGLDGGEEEEEEDEGEATSIAAAPAPPPRLDFCQVGSDGGPARGRREMAGNGGVWLCGFCYVWGRWVESLFEAGIGPCILGW